MQRSLPTARRRVAAALVVTVLAACGTSGGEGRVAVSARARSTAGADTAPTATALDRFGGELLTQLAATQQGNVVVSPYSVLFALLMTRAGAAGATRAQLDAALHLAGIADPDAAFNALDRQLTSSAGTFRGADGKPVTLTLTTGNAVWAQDGYPVERAYLDLLATYYGAGVRLVDFARGTEGARKTINRWVASRTNDKIPELLQPGVLDTLTRVVLTNAVYLNAPWAEPFSPAATAIAPFTRLDRSRVDASFVHATQTLRYGRGSGWQSVEIPYVDGKLALLVVAPDADRFADVSATAAQGFAPFVPQTTTPVALALPKFKFRTKSDLVDALTALGIVDLFDDRADLRLITTAEKLYVSDVIHEALIDVNEKGTEAAAATAVVIRATAAPNAPQRLDVDRPFLFAIRDVESGLVVFSGRVLDPTAT